MPREVLKFTKRHSPQQTHSGHKEERSHPQEGEEQQGEEEPEQGQEPNQEAPSSGNFPLCTEGDVSGTGPTCSQLGAAALDDCQLLAAWGPGQARSVSQQKQDAEHHEGQGCNPSSAPGPPQCQAGGAHAGIWAGQKETLQRPRAAFNLCLKRFLAVSLKSLPSPWCVPHLQQHRFSSDTSFSWSPRRNPAPALGTPWVFRERL